MLNNAVIAPKKVVCPSDWKKSYIFSEISFQELYSTLLQSQKGFSLKMIVIGIDPGKNSGIAIWNYGLTKALKCPGSIPEMASVVSDCIGRWKSTEHIIAYVERVHAFPTDGRSSAFKFGQNYGQWLGILAAFNIKTVLVTPQMWMKYYKEKYKIKLPKDKRQRKNKLKELAKKYTDKKVTLYNADAILIAVYGFIEQSKEKEHQHAK